MRKPKGSECECTMCGRFFGSESAFNLHLRQAPHWDCVDPETVVWGPDSSKEGKPKLHIVNRSGGPTWVEDTGRKWPGLAGEARRVDF